MADDVRPCPCGSGLPSRWLKDARGIEVARACDKCRAEKMAGYRSEIFTDPQYETTEDVEDEYLSAEQLAKLWKPGRGEND